MMRKAYAFGREGGAENHTFHPLGDSWLIIMCLCYTIQYTNTPNIG